VGEGKEENETRKKGEEMPNPRLRQSGSETRAFHVSELRSEEGEGGQGGEKMVASGTASHRMILYHSNYGSDRAAARGEEPSGGKGGGYDCTRLVRLQGKSDRRLDASRGKNERGVSQTKRRARDCMELRVREIMSLKLNK